MAKGSNVTLVHGAWADGSSWSKVIPLLLAAPNGDEVNQKAGAQANSSQLRGSR
jgi:hypothetical protein